MDEKLNKEVLRLVKEIRDDEDKLKTAEHFNNENKAKPLRESINRKIELLKILKA